MLRLVGQVRPTVLHLCDLRVRVLRRLPLLVRRLPVLPGPVKPRQLRSRRRLNPRCLRQLTHERLVRFPGIPPLDAPHRRVRFQRRRIDADRLPLHQTRSRQPFQHPRENRHVRFHVDQTPRARQRRVVRRRLGHVQVQESPQAQRIRDPPRNPPLRRQTLEVADEQQPEIPPRTQTRAAQPRRVEHRAQPLHKGIESGLLQNPVQPFEKGMSRARRKVRCGHPHRRRLSRRRLLAHCHAAKSTPLRRLRSTPIYRLLPQAVNLDNSPHALEFSLSPLPHRRVWLMVAVQPLVLFQTLGRFLRDWVAGISSEVCPEVSRRCGWW